MKQKYWLATKPYSFADAVNRAFAAQGSVGFAQQVGTEGYNGKTIHMSFNDYRQYWVAESYWGERVVAGRGEFGHVLGAAIDAYKQQGRGTELIVTGDFTAEQVQAIEAAGLTPYNDTVELAHRSTFVTWTADDVRKELAKVPGFNVFGYREIAI